MLQPFVLEGMESRRLMSGVGAPESLGEPILPHRAPAAEDAGSFRASASQRFEALTAKIPAVAGQPFRVGPTIFLNGSSGNDTLTVTSDSTGKLSFAFNGTTKTIDGTRARRLNISMGDGNDTVTISLSTSGIIPYVHGDGGNDTLTSNVTAELDGGAGNDTLTGSTFIDRLIGGDGDDTIKGGAGADIISPGPGVNNVTYPNGDIDVGDLHLHFDKTANLFIRGSAGNDKFVFASDTTTLGSTLIRVTLGANVTTFDLSKYRSVTVDGGPGKDEVTVPTGLFGTKPFSKRSIEVTP